MTTKPHAFVCEMVIGAEYDVREDTVDTEECGKPANGFIMVGIESDDEECDESHMGVWFHCEEHGPEMMHETLTSCGEPVWGISLEGAVQTR